MCHLSEKLKLCTCTDAGTLTKDYWTLYRFQKGKNLILVGEIMMPLYLPKEVNEFNEKRLTDLLNTAQPFDFPIELKDKDRISLHFNFQNLHGTLAYGFEYRGGQWHPEPFDVFAWERQYQVLQEGSIETENEKVP